MAEQHLNMNNDKESAIIGLPIPFIQWITNIAEYKERFDMNKKTFNIAKNAKMINKILEKMNNSTEIICELRNRRGHVKRLISANTHYIKQKMKSANILMDCDSPSKSEGRQVSGLVGLQLTTARLWGELVFIHAVMGDDNVEMLKTVSEFQTMEDVIVEQFKECDTDEYDNDDEYNEMSEVLSVPRIRRVRVTRDGIANLFPSVVKEHLVKIPEETIIMVFEMENNRIIEISSGKHITTYYTELIGMNLNTRTKTNIIEYIRNLPEVPDRAVIKFGNFES